MSETITTAEAWTRLRKAAEELQLLRQARSRLSASDPVGKRNIAQLSVGIRKKFDEHKSLRELLIARGEISG